MTRRRKPRSGHRVRTVSTLAYVNDQFIPFEDLALPLDDAGVVWGAIVTDRLRTFGGRLFAVDAHLRRFRQSCELACIAQPVSDARLARATERLVRDNRAGGEVSAVWLATPGPISGNARPTLIAYTLPFNPLQFESLFRQGARLVPVPATPGVDPRVKHRSRLPWWIAREQAHAVDPAAEPLLVEPKSETVLETPSANVVAVFDGMLVSPPRDRILRGVSLGMVEELGKGLDLRFSERPFTVRELDRAEEVLLANTTYCLAGVSRIGDQSIPFPGPIFNRLLDAWSQSVGVDLRGQMIGRS